MVNAMLLKVSCEPKVTASLTLSFDDGTVKELDIKTGMYGTFTYMSHGAATKVSGVVADVSSGRTTKKPPVHVSEPVGYQCDPNYTNSGFLDARPKPHFDHRHDHNCHPPIVDSVYNDFCIITVETPYGKHIKLDTNNILDVDVIYMDSKEVCSPDDETRVRLIRENYDVLEYSLDGVEWKQITAEMATVPVDVQERIEANYKDITYLRETVSSLKEQVADLSSAIELLLQNKEDTPSVDDSGSESTTESESSSESTTESELTSESTSDAAAIK